MKTTKRILATIPDAVVNQDADDGANVLFHVDHFDAVAGLLRLRKLTPEQRAARIETLRQYQFNEHRE